VKRREFITLISGAAAAWPLAARAQQPARVPRIGFLFYGAPELSLEIDAFRQGLRELGYIEGQNIFVEYRFAGGQVGKLPELAAELVRLKVEVIVTPTMPASMAAKQATSTIPIVIAAVADAVGAGLVTNFSRPGGNITGCPVREEGKADHRGCTSRQRAHDRICGARTAADRCDGIALIKRGPSSRTRLM
jgi:putative tryptophan/tyrosine transport system substrate-binding protein